MQNNLRLSGNFDKIFYKKLSKSVVFFNRHKWKATAGLAEIYKPQEIEAGKGEKLYEPGRIVQGARETPTFRMLLPPPNITGNLHLGHALMATVQDVICRHKKLLGYDVEWTPGTDHAGIATQVVVEKKLCKEYGVTRQDIGREKFLREIWKWKEDKVNNIRKDLKNLGCLLWWNREYFTMDKTQAHAVNEAFIRLFEQGLINRQESLVNWSCALESAISDIEVEFLNLRGPTQVAVPGYDKNITFGRIFDIKYKVLDNAAEDHITVSTTRPETMLGDVAIAVHPFDERYLKYRESDGVCLMHPLRHQVIPLIFDVGIDPHFGTGAVKITPAHDHDDFKIAKKHELNPIQVFSSKGFVVEDHKDFALKPRFIAREEILQKLGEQNLLVSIRDHSMQLPICSRSKDVVEYMLKEQWFLKCQQLALNALSEVESGRLQIIPNKYEIEWQRWLEDCHDWCISRQLWWGHQIPAYKVRCNDESRKEVWVAAHDEQEALMKSLELLKCIDVSITRDQDVLDTWFSSALLPLSISGWPNKEIKGRYPLDLIETGHDILFFWVARMVMLGLIFTGQTPFKRILLNGIVCDAHGRKMSKSLGNIVTPQQVVQGITLDDLQKEIKASHKAGILSESEMQKSLIGAHQMFPSGIPECGTDALRFTLCSYNIKNHFINFDVTECYTNKKFLNKIWQAARFTVTAAEGLKMSSTEFKDFDESLLSRWDLWILSRLAHTLQQCNESIEDFNLHFATSGFKKFFYNEICDIYLEITKNNIKMKSPEGYVQCAVLCSCLNSALQAMQPFTPFICEELLKYIPQPISLDLNKFFNSSLEREIEEIVEVCEQIRQLKGRHQISRKHEPHLILYAHSIKGLSMLQPHLSEIKTLTLTNAIEVRLLQNNAQIHKDLTCYSTAGYMCSFGIVTNELYAEEKKIAAPKENINNQKLSKLEKELERYSTRWEDEGFRKSASSRVQQKHFQKIQQLKSEIDKIKTMI
uniref:valine--tRNA ligase n=1 Tax=Glossina brevipalpis TaxID=37001 RepID=A0A1A9WPX6_9MUSC